jgi:hypothetical protein
MELHRKTGGSAWQRISGNERKAETNLRTPDLAWRFWAVEENDSTQSGADQMVARDGGEGETRPCRSFSCPCFHRV